MQPQTDGDYAKLFSEIIKKQIVVLGPSITLAKVKNVNGIKVDENGNVLGVTGDPRELLSQLIDQFVDLSGMIVKKTMESILLNYPGLAGITTSSLANGSVHSAIDGLINEAPAQHVSSAPVQGSLQPQVPASPPSETMFQPPTPPQSQVQSQAPVSALNPTTQEVPTIQSMDDIDITQLNKMFEETGKTS